jgi:ribonuclease J
MMKLRIVFLGGVGEVTKNMFVYELWDNGRLRDSIIVDCGIGFSEDGRETLLPDVSYIENIKKTIRAVLLTHGHEDHTSGLFHLFSTIKPPVFGTKLTTALAETKLSEFSMSGNFQSIKTGRRIQIGLFTVQFIHVTHSIPDATNILIKTPAGSVLHAADFKFDWTPVDGWQTDVGSIAAAGNEGILCLLSDCVRSERTGYTLSEATIEDELETVIRKSQGKVIFTTMSSNISRIQQAVSVAARYDRTIAFMGRSMKKAVEVSSRFGYLNLRRNKIVDISKIHKISPNKVFLIVAGSQAQDDSALSKIVYGNSRFVALKHNDIIVFSQDPIPGYEKQVHNLINSISERGVQVVYSDINDELHVSGHGAAYDLMLMIGLSKPDYLIPIGGEARHVRQYFQIAGKMGYKENQCFAPSEGYAVEFSSGTKPIVLKDYTYSAKFQIRN